MTKKQALIAKIFKALLRIDSMTVLEGIWLYCESQATKDASPVADQPANAIPFKQISGG